MPGLIATLLAMLYDATARDAIVVERFDPPYSGESGAHGTDLLRR